MPKVIVSFPLREDVWLKVVGQSQEAMTVESEQSDTFLVEYANQDAFNNALTRFDGMVEYTVQCEDPLQIIFDAADAHGEDTGEPDHTVGDLQDVLREAWSLMSLEQRAELMDTEVVQNILEMNGFSFVDEDGDN